jgi:hypothetical protein
MGNLAVEISGHNSGKSAKKGDATFLHQQRRPDRGEAIFSTVRALLFLLLLSAATLGTHNRK